MSEPIGLGADGTAAEARPRWPALQSLLAAVILVLLSILFVGAWLAWNQAWRQAEAELARTADAAAEYAAHLLDGHLLLADRIDDLIRGLTDVHGNCGVSLPNWNHAGSVSAGKEFPASACSTSFRVNESPEPTGR